MGVLLSRFRAKPSTKDLLEDLEKEIESLEEYKRSTEQQHKRVVGSVIFYSILLYILGAGVFFVYYFPAVATKDRILYSVPLLMFPIILYLFKKFLHWYFTQKIRYNEETLSDLKKRRRSLLDYAMETETYRVVKELLEKYDPDYHKKIFEYQPAIEAPPLSMPTKGSFSEADLRRRTPPSKMPLTSQGQTITLSSAAGPQVFPPFPGKSPTNPPFPPAYLQRNGQHYGVRSPGQQMPRPVLPRERTLIDRLVDYLVGDGPSNRYALICRQCQSHNGMALREEFEFIAFRCCYCFNWNPPRNQQSPPPRLPLPAPSSIPTVTEPDSVSQMSSSSDETEIENLSDGDGSTASGHFRNRNRDSPKSTSLSQRCSISSDNEIIAHLEEEKSHSDSESRSASSKHD